MVPVWASEIEEFPIKVTSIRLPEMKHMGDITKLHGANLPVVDVIAGGSPCQDLSVAGLRVGLAGERSGLFLEQVRLVKEMRKQDGRRKRRGQNDRRTNQSVRPRYMVWENVPGAFSSGEEKGEDFHTVLEEICRVSEEPLSLPGPPGGVWTPAGCIMGEGFSVAWRVLDAQFFGVPQRRRRIFLVADFGGHSAGEILFESDRVYGYYQKVKGERERTTKNFIEGSADAGRGIEKSVVCLVDQGGERMDAYKNIMGTLTAHGGANPPLLMESSQGGTEIGDNDCPSLTVFAGRAVNNLPLLFDNHGPDTRYTGPVTVAQTITSALGTGGNNTPLAVNSEPFCIAGNIVNRKDKNGGNGCGYQQGICYTITTEDRHCVMENHATAQNVTKKKKLVRKLIPLECERLMGFPDGWTDIPGACDSKRYRALGNSVAVPCVDYIFCGIAYFISLERMEE